MLSKALQIVFWPCLLLTLLYTRHTLYGQTGREQKHDKYHVDTDTSDPNSWASFEAAVDREPGWHYWSETPITRLETSDLALTVTKLTPLRGAPNLRYAELAVIKQNGEMAVTLCVFMVFFDESQDSIYITAGGEDGPAETFSCMSRHHIVAVRDTKRFLDLIRRSKTLVVTAHLERVGGYTMEFNVRDFQW